MKKIAVVFGATGLVGKQLVKQLLEDKDFAQVKVFVRREIGYEDPKLEQNIIDFDKADQWKDKVTGDIIFSSLGTTIKKAKTKEAQYKVDYTYQYRAAECAAANGVTTLVLVSSSGANHNSKIFYTRMKGELDRDVQNLSFKSIRIMKPSILAGEREEKRTAESIGLAAGRILTKLPFIKKYRPIEGATVAKGMIRASHEKGGPRYREYELDEIFNLTDS